MLPASHVHLSPLALTAAIALTITLGCGRSMLAGQDGAASGTGGNGGITLPAGSTGGTGGAATAVGCAASGIAFPDDAGVQWPCPCTVSSIASGQLIDSDPTGSACSSPGLACHYLGWSASSGCGLTDCFCTPTDAGSQWRCWGPLCY